MRVNEMTSEHGYYTKNGLADVGLTRDAGVRLGVFGRG